MNLSDELLEKGYCILRGCVPRQRLDSLRAHCEEMLARHRTWWADHREQGEPPGGEWETGIQPRVLFDRVVDREACEIVDFVFHENTHGICRQVMGTEDVAPTQFGMLCNPRRDRGPADWHRDIRPESHGPVEAFFTDFLANPPNYTQWNIPLYDDGVLWLVPGSHRRFNTEAENRQLAVSEHRKIDGGVQIELAAGDGIVYLTPILHWGSNYSAKRRRTLHFGYRAFNNGSLTHAYIFHWTPGLVDVLPPRHASRFRRLLDLRDRECDAMERAFRAMIGRDAAAFCEALHELHSGEVGRVSCLIQLSKIARAALRGRGPVGSRFTAAEAGLLWRRFESFDRLLQVEEPHLVPGFQGKQPSRYRFQEMPGIDVDGFTASWEGRTAAGTG